MVSPKKVLFIKEGNSGSGILNGCRYVPGSAIEVILGFLICSWKKRNQSASHTVGSRIHSDMRKPCRIVPFAPMQWYLGYSIVIETIVKTTTNNMGDIVCISGVDT